MSHRLRVFVGPSLLGLLLCLSLGCATRGPSPREVPLDPQVEVVYGSRVETFDTLVSTLAQNVPRISEDAPSVEAVAQVYRERALAATDTAAFYGVMEAMISELGISHVGVIPPPSYGPALANPAPAEEALAGDRLGTEVEGAPPPAPPPAIPSAAAGAGAAGFDARLVGDVLYITALPEGSAAWTAGLRPGMALLKIGDFEVAALLRAAQRSPEAERPIFVREAALRVARGPVGDPLVIEARPPEGEAATFEVILTPWSGRDSRFGHIVLSGGVESREVAPGIGYVALSVFAFDLMGDLEAALRSFGDAEGLILDLRGNLGGVAGMSQALAGFITDAPFSLGRTEGPGVSLDYVVFPRPNPYTGPLVVLVDGLSASTSEILAAGLKGVGRATIVGEVTAGMVLPSMVVRLPDGGLLQYATALYITPEGEILEGVGVVPDVSVAPDPEAWYRGEDPALDRGVALLREALKAPSPVP